MSTTTYAENGRRTEHLGATWEIAIVTVFVALILIIIGTVIFQIRRNQKRRQQQEEEETIDVETGRTTTGDSARVDKDVPPKVKSSASLKRSSTMSASSTQQQPTKPSRYYWDHR